MQPTKNETLVTVPSEAEDVSSKPSPNYAAVRFNALKHGILSRHTVLAHEDAGEYRNLFMALVEEHQPAAATEVHLVEDLAAIIWRKRRVLQAEGASINRGLKGAVKDAEAVFPAAAPFEHRLSGKDTDLRDLMVLTKKEVAERLRDAQRDRTVTQKAARILDRGAANAYERALRVLRADSREWWEQCVEDEDYAENAEGLASFIADLLEPLCIAAEKEAIHHEAIKAQALGEGLQAYRLEKLSRYETHLDRKFERTLAMLIKLKELRRAR